MSRRVVERLHWTDTVGAICGRAHPIAPKYARTLKEITCKSCAKKLGMMLGEFKHFAKLVKDVTEGGR